MNNKIKLALALAMALHVATRPSHAEECEVVDDGNASCGPVCDSANGTLWTWQTVDCGGGIGGTIITGCDCLN